MFVEIDDVEVAVPQPVIDAFVALDQFEKSDAIEQLSDDAYSMQFDSLVEQLVAVRATYFPKFGEPEFDQLDDQIWTQIL